MVAHAELKAGLPEVNVGLIPAWGGCTQLLLLADAARGFETIFSARISGSAEEARAAGLLRPSDAIAMSRAALIGHARDAALALLPGYTPPERAMLRVAGASSCMGLLSTTDAHVSAGRLTATDAGLARRLASVLTGGAGAESFEVLDEAAMMALEHEALLSLAGTEETRARMEHMLKTGKPLRN